METLTSMDNLALTYCEQGRLDEAEELNLEVMEKRRKILGADHPDTLTSMNNLSFIWKAMGEQTQALKLMNEGKEFAEDRLDEILEGTGFEGTPEQYLDQIYITVLQSSIPTTLDYRRKYGYVQGNEESSEALLSYFPRSPLPR
jgi:hypothetical protein